MLTSEDIQNLINAQKELFVTKEELVTLEYNLNLKFDKLLTAVDAIAKNNKDSGEEAIVMRHRMERMEDWIKHAAAKVGVEYKT